MAPKKIQKRDLERVQDRKSAVDGAAMGIGPILNYKNFGKKPFACDIALGTVKVLGIAGPSGIGKSTLLRSLAFLEPDIKGECWQGDLLVWKDGRPTSPAFSLLKESFGFVFQDLYLWNHLSVLENVSLALTVHKKFSPTEARALAMDLLKNFSIDRYHAKRPSQISGGEAQRLAWARALALNPSLIFMDEPSSALDTKIRDECFAIVTEVYPDLDFVVVSHDEPWLKKICGDVIYLEEKLCKNAN